MVVKKAHHGIRARLTLYDFAEMDKKQLRFFRKWIKAVAEEMQTANPADYSKIFRATLFK